MKPERARVLSEGLVAGLLGYAVIALFFGSIHLFTGQSLFHTAAALGEGLVSHDASILGGAAAGPVIAFNGVHMLAFVLFGVIAAWLVSHAERNPGFFIIMLFLGLAGFFYSLSGFLGFSIDRPLAPSWITVALANVIAGLFMAGYLFRAHPGLWEVVRTSTDSETEHQFPAAGTGPRMR